MKKIILSIALMVCAVFAVNAQVFDESSRYVGVGVGFGGGYGIPVSVSYEQGITENIGVGGIVGLGIDKESIGVYDMTYTNILIGVRGNYHFNISDSFDVYAGLILGYNAASASSDPDGWDVSVGGMIFGGQVGTRYCFSDKWAAFAELGYGLGLFSLGATYSF